MVTVYQPKQQEFAHDKMLVWKLSLQTRLKTQYIAREDIRARMRIESTIKALISAECSPTLINQKQQYLLAVDVVFRLPAYGQVQAVSTLNT